MYTVYVYTVFMQKRTFNPTAALQSDLWIDK